MYRTTAPFNIANQFTDGDPNTGQEAAVVDSIWLNGVQEELIGLIVAAGIVPDAANVTQLLQAIRRLSGAHSSGINTDTTLILDHSGLVSIDAAAGPVVVTLPTAFSMPDGTGFMFRRLDGTANTVTIQRAGADTIDGANTYALTFGGESILILKAGATTWRKTAGNNAMALSGLLASQFLRSDADSTSTGKLSVADALIVSGDTPRLRLFQSTAPADEKEWELVVIAGQLVLRIANDSRNAFTTALTIDRTGTVIDVINLLATNVQVGGNTVLTSADIVVSGWRLGAVEYENKSVSASAQASSHNGVAFSADGTKMYLLSAADDSVYQYTLATAWDVSTATYAAKSFSGASQSSSIRSLAFSADGTKMYLGSNGLARVYQYTLSTAWDVSTATYAATYTGVASHSGMVGIAFSADGTKMYALDSSISDIVYQYTLATAWDVSTATDAAKNFSVTSETNMPFDLAFNADGTRLFVIGGSVIYQYDLSTAWDIATAAYTSISRSLTGQTSTTYGFSFSLDGAKLYAVDVLSAEVYQYTAQVAHAK